MKADRALSQAYRQATLACPLDGQGCPTPDELAAAARGTLPADRRDAIVAILANCAQCAALVQVAGDLDGDAPVVDAPPAGERSRPSLFFTMTKGLVALTERAKRPWGRAVTAGLALVALGGLLPMLLAPPTIPATRGVDGAAQPLDNAVLESAPLTMSWPAEKTFGACRVVVRDEAATIVLHGPPVDEGFFNLDAAQRAAVSRGRFLWTAECGGRRFGPYAFTVSP